MCYAPIIMQLYNQAATCELTKAMTGGCRGFRRDFRELTAKQGIRGLVHLGGFVKNVSIEIEYCQFSQQAYTNFMQTYLYLLISIHFFIQTTNLHCQISFKYL